MKIPRKKRFGPYRLLPLAVAVIFGSAFSQAEDRTGYICIRFDDAGCPVDISDADFVVHGEESSSPQDRIKRVEWRAVSELPGDGGCSDQTPTLDGTDFNVIFTPFGKGVMYSARRGIATSDKLKLNKHLGDGRQEIPADPDVVYKYTVFNPTCPDGPMDPRIRVQ